jgi:hypothetical protein
VERRQFGDLVDKTNLNLREGKIHRSVKSRPKKIVDFHDPRRHQIWRLDPLKIYETFRYRFKRFNALVIEEASGKGGLKTKPQISKIERHPPSNKKPMEGGMDQRTAGLPANCETCHKDRTNNQAFTSTIN